MADLSRLTLSELAAALAPRDYYTPDQAALETNNVDHAL